MHILSQKDDDIEIDKIKDHEFNYCLTACLWWGLQRKKANLLESDFVLCDFMLQTNVHKFALEVPIKKMVKENVIFQESKINKLEINSEIYKRGYIILKVESKLLDYAEIYTKTLKYDFHYIIVLNHKNDMFLILDLYIPTKPSSMFYGWIKLGNIEQIDMLDVIDCKLNINAENKIIKLINSIDGFMENNEIFKMKMEENFKLLYYNQQDYLLKNRISLYNAAVDTAVKGAQASRIFFLKEFLDIIPEQKFFFQEIYKNLDDLYYTYRLLLMKNSVALREQNIENLYKIYIRINSLENEIFRKQKDLLVKHKFK